MLEIYYFYFAGNNGVGIAARNYIEVLRQKYHVLAFPIDTGRVPEKTQAIRIYHCVPDYYKRFRGKEGGIGFATFENPVFPSYWLPLLSMNDVIIVPSQFNYNTFSPIIKQPVFKIPHCLDFSKWHPTVNKMFILNKFTFLFLGTWKKRKGYPQLLQAFTENLAKENIRLVIKSGKNEQLENLEDSRIKVISDEFSDDEMPSFIKSFDCLVMPTLGEGFGLTAIEAMAVGVPVIVTNYSGCQDYANQDTSWLLEPENFQEIANLDNLKQFRNLSWPVISSSQISAKMKEVIENPNLRKIKAENALYFVRDNFNYDKNLELWDEAITWYEDLPNPADL